MYMSPRNVEDTQRPDKAAARAISNGRRQANKRGIRRERRASKERWLDGAEISPIDGMSRLARFNNMEEEEWGVHEPPMPEVKRGQVAEQTDLYKDQIRNAVGGGARHESRLIEIDYELETILEPLKKAEKELKFLLKYKYSSESNGMPFLLTDRLEGLRQTYQALKQQEQTLAIERRHLIKLVKVLQNGPKSRYAYKVLKDARTRSKHIRRKGNKTRTKRNRLPDDLRRHWKLARNRVNVAVSTWRPPAS
jgi:hypothetical protein